MAKVRFSVERCLIYLIKTLQNNKFKVYDGSPIDQRLEDLRLIIDTKPRHQTSEQIKSVTEFKPEVLMDDIYDGKEIVLSNSKRK